MGKVGYTIHANPRLKHQVDYAEAFAAGFAAHGDRADITRDPNRPADVHVIIGPWFALKPWQHDGDYVLYVDRAYWGDPEAVSAHWLRMGEKVFEGAGAGRPHPEAAPYKTGRRSIYLCDYGDTPKGRYDTVRRHPAESGRPERDLAADLAEHDLAVGKRTTALVDAALAGLRVETPDVHSPVFPIRGRVCDQAREVWLCGLSWHNWGIEEIRTGAAWEYLRQLSRQRNTP